ncbi:MAG: mechanosensitive ion channel family protein [Clostridiales bacterium]|nr:mechanosensitive ion channel family protein [Candidatus Cacconaster stercorequi]
MAFLSTITAWITNVGLNVLVALIILLISFRIINTVSKRISVKLAASDKLDETLTKALCNVATIALKVLVVVCLIGYLGIETSGISAVIASLGVCVGLAVNGTLSNLAGGAMILITRPFKVGDYISAQGYDGTVEEILICSTKILTVDNKVVYLPNSALSTGTIVNFSEKELRRVDLDFSVAGNDPVKVRDLLLNICAQEALVLNDPAPFARITDFGAGNGTKITLRAWCKSADYWDTYFALLDSAQKAFETEHIVVPFNQLDVHIKNS